MKRIILFRFHTHPSLCIDRLKLLRKHNSEIKIFGLYGGLENQYGEFVKALHPYLEEIYCIRDKTTFWKWKNGDLAVRSWYQDIGNRLSFDMLHLIEWDLLFFDSINRIYSEIPKGGVGLTSLTPMETVKEWWVWTNKKPYTSEFIELLNYARDRFGYRMKPYAAQGPGMCLPRGFLEAYSSAEIPELCNDEVRIPLFSQIFGFKLYDTRFIENWTMQSTLSTFHCNLLPEVTAAAILKELADPSGKRVFHPFKRSLAANSAGPKAGLHITIEEKAAFLWKRSFHSVRGMLGLNRL
jgi:hypothetical protein